MAEPTALPPRPRQLGRKLNFAIIASQYNPDYVQGLVDATSSELYEIQPNCAIHFFQVPGAFEIPMLAQEIAIRLKPDVIIAIGVIIRGETDHAELIARSTTDALQSIALSHRIPVLDAVLSVHDEAQAHSRCLDPEKNRGIEVARAAAQLVEVLSELRAK